MNNQNNQKSGIITIVKSDKVKDKIIKKGEVLLEENNFFNDLENTMQNPDFRNFYDKYFRDYSDIKTVVLYMKLYETIESEYKKINGKDIEKEFLAYMMKELMCDNVMRKNIIKTFNQFEEHKQHNNKFLLDIFDMDTIDKNYKKNRLEYKYIEKIDNSNIDNSNIDNSNIDNSNIDNSNIDNI